MEIDRLKRFAGFDGWSPAQLKAVASRAQCLRVPAGRWLVRPGRSLSNRVFLLEGRVRLVQGGRSVIVGAHSALARRAVYPGAAGVQTLTAAVFLSVDPAVLESARVVAVSGSEAMPAVPEVNAAEASWQRRFLTSPLMQRLGPAAWQRILRAMHRDSFPAGARVIEAGDPASCCYVLCAGRAEIRAAGSGDALARLRPGCLFGEDALVSGASRNASVVMTTSGSVVSLAAEQFQAWLLDVVVRPLPQAGERPVVSLSGPGPDGAVQLAVRELRGVGTRLSPHEHYAVVGGTWRERALAAFLLAEQGIDASPVHGP